MLAIAFTSIDPDCIRIGGLDEKLRPITISLPENALPGSVLFCRNQNFFKKLQEAKGIFLKDPILDKLCFILDLKLVKELEEGKNQFFLELKEKSGGLFTSPHLDITIAKISEYFYQELHLNLNDFVDGRQMGTAEIHPTALIAQNVFLGENVKIGANVIIHSGCVILSHSEISDGTILFPNVVIYRFNKIGKNCRIHANVTIGADGFGYHFFQGAHVKVWHLCGVIIHDDVEIGANSCIDQGAFRPTIIGRGSKIDNQVQVGHNVQLGKGVILCGQVGVAGSTTIGDYTVAGGGAGIGPDLEIGSACQIAGMAGLNCDLENGSKVAGHPARPVAEWLRGIATLRKLSLKQNKK